MIDGHGFVSGLEVLSFSSDGQTKEVLKPCRAQPYERLTLAATSEEFFSSGP